MSRCRCSDINIYEEYIRRLDEADHEIGCCESRFQNISGILSTLAVYSRIAFEASNGESLFYGIQNADNDLIAIKDAYRAKVRNKKQELESNLSSMKSEDHDYHEEERRREEEEERLRQLQAAANATAPTTVN